jgi:hypothetical protein
MQQTSMTGELASRNRLPPRVENLFVSESRVRLSHHLAILTVTLSTITLTFRHHLLRSQSHYHNIPPLQHTIPIHLLTTRDAMVGILQLETPPMGGK